QANSDCQSHACIAVVTADAGDTCMALAVAVRLAAAAGATRGARAAAAVDVGLVAVLHHVAAGERSPAAADRDGLPDAAREHHQGKQPEAHGSLLAWRAAARRA